MVAPLLLVLMGVTPVHADYGPENEAWNGLTYLATTAEEASVSLEVTSQVDLDGLRPRDVLWLMYPNHELPVQDLISFVREGGRLIIADDHGTSGELIEGLGLSLEPGPPQQVESFAEGRTSLPVLRAEAPHFVFFNVVDVVANHPAVLTGAGAPLLSFPGETEHLVAEVSMGSGQALVISDPSLFINSMLRRYYGNKQFAANVLRVYCPRDECAVTLALPETTYTGSYRKGLGLMGDAPSVFRDAGLMIDQGLERLSLLLSGRPGSSVLMVLLLWGVLAILWMQVKRRIDSPHPPPLADLHPTASPLEVERLGLSGAREDADFQVQARTLIAEAETLMRRAAAQQRAASEPWLRIQSALLSLERAEPCMVTAEQFLTLNADLEALRREREAQP